MRETILAVRTDALRKLLGSRPFIALPREEIDRLHASIEVFTADNEQADADPAITQLVAFTAVHYNYTWLACCPGSNHDGNAMNAWSAGFIGHIFPEGNNSLFLDESLKTAASRIVDANVAVPAGYDVRLAGLLCDDSTPFGRRHLGLAYVVKLRQPGVDDRRNGEAGIRFYGIGELRQNRDRFDTWSQLLIDHLVAL
jgi:predicted NUDIX family phosphoesterase